MTKYSITTIILISVFIAWLINMDLLFPTNNPSLVLNAQQKAINQCTNIAENAVAHLQEIVAFQKLEKIGRKARVMRMCMHDHHYQQNPQWTTKAKILAKSIAKQKQISIAEAYENLRRSHSVLLKTESAMPEYWTNK